MTEQDWLTSDNPAAMLAQFVPPGGRSSGLGAKLQSFPISDRKLRLWAVACCRACWSLLTDPRSRQAVEVAERFADGLATEEECLGHGNWTWHPVGLERMLRLITKHANPPTPPPAAQAALLREIVCNPWRPAKLAVLSCSKFVLDNCLALARTAYEERVDVKCGRCKGEKGEWTPAEINPRWIPCPDCHGSGVAFHGALDPDRLLILADALEGSGCTDEFLLSHLRGLELVPDAEMPNKYRWHRLRGPHVRGCWAVDALLGKEAVG